MSSQESNPTEVNLEISYTRLSPSLRPNDNDPSHAPIVFLHGISTCNKEFSRVTPFLAKDYDLILVDLPGHSGSKNILPFTMDNAISALSHLISTKIAGGRAHIVGMSLGGCVGLEFARRRPELVLSLFCTGCAPLSGYRKWFISRPRLMGGIEIAAGKLATEALFWSFIGVEPLPGLREEMRRNHSMEMLAAGYGACTALTRARVAEIRGVRVAIVAGGKRDNVEETREAGKVLANTKLPELFAQGVRAWVEGGKMPKEFEELK
ncbi:alpha/beta-hydrolase [Trematosphaeria pertusa]|uniref:Alpha/beta-hydrolase n=1 Tax=Trematosphaeria pertusa TaxID=390896 RepID=A0A6A6I6X3_9PLEO|nr:alpha/beta-hydrolase [Trematosphaeria pertusa]KAF2245273.1 alpha/beta-hydrolase [Trematosphaeria pertusa]